MRWLEFHANIGNLHSWQDSLVWSQLPGLSGSSLSSLLVAYTVLTELPAVFLLYDSSFWSGTFLIFIFAVSVWNGGGFYIEVFGRKYVSRFWAFAPLTFPSRSGLRRSWKRYARNLRMLHLGLRDQVPSLAHRAMTTCPLLLDHPIS